MKITAEFNTRGGISSVIEVEYYNDDFYEDEDEEESDDLLN